MVNRKKKNKGKKNKEKRNKEKRNKEKRNKEKRNKEKRNKEKRNKEKKNKEKENKKKDNKEKKKQKTENKKTENNKTEKNNNKGKIWGTEIPAYFTVEAAMVLPLTMGIVIFIIYMMIYRYDSCLFEQDAAILAMRGIVEQKNGIGQERYEVLQELQGRARNMDTDKYVAVNRTFLEVGMEGYLVRIVGNAEMNVPFAGMTLWTGQELWSMEAEYENRLVKPIGFLRLCRKMKRMAAARQSEAQ